MTPSKAQCGASSIMLSSGPIQLPISYLPPQTFRIPSPLGSSAEATAMLARQQLKKPPGFLQELQLSPRRPHPRAGLPMLESVEGVQSPRTWLPTSPRGRVHVRSLVLDEPAGPPAEPAVPAAHALASSPQPIKASVFASATPIELSRAHARALSSPSSGDDESTEATDKRHRLRLLDDMRWILFNKTDVYQPREMPSALSPEQLADVVDTLSRVHLFRRLSDQQLSELRRLGKHRLYPRYDGP